MVALAGVSFLAFLVGSLVLGVRLALLWRRTHEFPELAIAIALLVGGVLGYGLIIVNGPLGLTPEALRYPIGLFATLAFYAGCIAVALFTRRVFRPDPAWGAGLVATTVCLFTVAFVESVIQPAPRGAPMSEAVFWPSTAGSLVCYAWTTVEALAFWLRLRRRVALGLADPVVADRVRLWAVSAACPVLTSFLFVGSHLAGETTPPEWFLVVSYLGILVGIVCNWLVFFPPAGYLRRLRGAPAEVATHG